MKKVSSVILVIILALSAVACGEDKTVTKYPQETKRETSTTAEKTTMSQAEKDSAQREKSFTDMFFPEKMRYGMCAQEVKDNETGEKSLSIGDKEYTYVSYYTYGKNKAAGERVYCFSNDKLIVYMKKFSGVLMSDYLGYYKKVKEKIDEKYGECKSENFNWNDETYKDDPSMFNKAYEYGYVKIEAKWELSDGQVVIVRWDGKDDMTVATTTKENENKL